jgi:hypothetical protein
MRGAMSVAFRGLQVTEPTGQQKSTLWLQLPLPFAIPLMAVSTLLHWLVSSSIYMIVGEGGTYSYTEGIAPTVFKLTEFVKRATRT